MRDPVKLGRRVVITPKGKPGGGKRTGKLAVLYITDDDNNEVEYLRVEAPQFKGVQKKLRATGLIPTGVSLKHHGETRF